MEQIQYLMMFDLWFMPARHQRWGEDRNINNEEKFKHNTHSSSTKNSIMHTHLGNFLAWFNLVEKSGNKTEHFF